MKLRRLMLMLPVALIGCASPTREQVFEDVAQLTGERLVWRTGAEADRQADEAVRQVLGRRLTADDAVQIALLNNRRLQATYEDLGVSLADVVEAGLLKNPTFSAQVRFPDRPPSAANLEFDAAMDFLDLLLLPIRKRLAGQQFERAKLLVADAVLGSAAQVRVAYFTAVAAQQSASMRRAVLEAAQASYELARRMDEAGNLSPLALAQEQAAYEQAKIDAARADGEALETREALTRLMGLWGEQVSWTAVDALDAVPSADPDLARIESIAMEKRLDLAAAKREAQVLATTLGLTRDYRWLSAIEVGPSAEREPDKTWVIGPHVSVELPIFNQGQPRVARAESQLRQAEARLVAMAVDLRSEVRAAANRLVIARRTAEHYRLAVLPLRQRIVQLAQQEYNFMLHGVFEIIAAKQQEYDTYEQYIHAVRDYWTARAELERAMGARLPSDAAAQPVAPAPRGTPSESTNHKHDHGAKP